MTDASRTDGPCLYVGEVFHRRLKPRAHHLRYGLFYCLLELGDDAAPRSLSRLFSVERFNLFSFFARDHGDGGDRDLRDQITAMLAQAGIAAPGTIRLLCLPRILGYAFNPLSVYFCYAVEGGLAAIVYEVHNTFRQRHAYVIPVDGARPARNIRQICPKRLHVSPFIEMAMTYHFDIDPPGETIAIRIREDDRDGTLLLAGFSGRYVAFSDSALLRLFFAYPLVTLKVIWGIHWEALRLFAKRLRIYPCPPAPTEPFTIVARNDA